MKKRTMILFAALLLGGRLLAQEKLYTNEFNLRDVALLESPFKRAEQLNLKVLLQYDTDRLLEPFLTEAGLTAKGKRYTNWDGLAGHVGGHYLTALAIHYASTGNAECKTRMDYMIDELKRCQDANADGYVGGIPGSKAMWAEMKQGKFELYSKAWVPWYNLHKTYAGLRDAWLYGNSETARDMFLNLCDWGIDIIANLDEAQMQRMLDVEFGGMNESYADAYQMTGDKKYLDAAKRFTHRVLYNSMVKGVDNLDNMHANTQIPKVVGFARIAQLDAQDHDYWKASQFFFETVVNNRSLALGGNSRGEHFASKENCHEYVSHREGPESCNTYNMMKLSEDLFKIKPEAAYVDFYERALYNHILSTQHPEHGGYVYFTPARPRHYRVYSQPNQAMWCCVGSGMENHGKYGQMIYTHLGSDSLLVNLFIPSELKWNEKGVTITQKTSFPEEEKTQLTIDTRKPQSFKLLLRHPSWVKPGGFEVKINGKAVVHNSKPGSYFAIDRTWKKGDRVEVSLPMQLTFEQMPNVPEYIALMYGPILLGAKTGTDNLEGLIADDGRWAHIANGSLMDLTTAPVLVGSRDSLALNVEPVKGKSLTFKVKNVVKPQSENNFVLEPFYNIHDSRYMMYWLSLSHNEYLATLEAMKQQEQEKLALDRRSVDYIATGEQQPDVDHGLKSENSQSGVFNNYHYRHAQQGGWFSYQMATKGETNLTLYARYWGKEWGNRTFDILVDGEVIATENLKDKWNKESFMTVEYAIPEALLKGKSTVTVLFRAKPDHAAGGVYGLRLLKKE
jgi:uncharacterized protein